MGWVVAGGTGALCMKWYELGVAGQGCTIVLVGRTLDGG